MTLATRPRIVPAVVATCVLCLPLSTSLAQPPLRMPTAQALNGRTYGVEFTQVVTFPEYGNAEVRRDVQLRVTLVQPSGPRHIRVRIDSARGSASDPHARSVLDLRSLTGTSLGVTYGESGHPVAWAEKGPEVRFADVGGSMALSLLLDPLFPALPARAVTVGTVWERVWTKSALVGQHIRTAQVRTQYTLEGTARAGDTAVWKVQFVTTPIPGSAGGSASTGTMLVGTDGVLQELTLTESVRGDDWVFSTADVGFTQDETIRVTLRGPDSPVRR